MTATATDIAMRFDAGRVISRSFAIARERWITLAILVLGGDVAPRLILGVVAKPAYEAGARDLRAVALHGAWSLGPALLGHVALAGVVRASICPKGESGLVAVLRAVALASPILFPVWLAAEYDTVFRLLNEWAQFFQMPAGLAARLGYLFGAAALDVAIAVGAVATVGVFTPVALSEHLGLRASLVRSWRLMAGRRWQVAGLYLALFVAAVLVSVFGYMAVRPIRSHAGATDNWMWVVRVLSAVVVNFWGVVIASSYLQLRRLHDGGIPEQLAEVFA